ncbi:PREDICTED: uncharacterized protein LOC108383078 [Rhagoletis zephyria]|uniref:uncharacterized protein LOC108383078 n=1 Tax=Rhagoletis zephyria TaxID=28612 RepID=UPI00081148A8|nr:PREDICTED: uncharacterized protein LOC108383078 [Rhagoletis zephyria]
MSGYKLVCITCMIKEYAEENEAINVEVTAQAHLENYADKQDRISESESALLQHYYYCIQKAYLNEILFNRNVAACIHNCQKNVEIPLTEPVAVEGGKFGASSGAEANASGDGKGYPEITAIPHDPLA